MIEDARGVAHIRFRCDGDHILVNAGARSRLERGHLMFVLSGGGQPDSGFRSSIVSIWRAMIWPTCPKLGSTVRSTVPDVVTQSALRYRRRVS